MNDSSNNDGFVVRSRPDAGIVVETRPLSDEDRRSLDVGDFFERDRVPVTSVSRLLAAMSAGEATSQEALILCTPPPSLARSYAQHWRLVVPFALATVYLATLRSLTGAALAGVTAGIAALPLRWWREERDEHRARQEAALRNIERRRAQREAEHG